MKFIQASIADGRVVAVDDVGQVWTIARGADGGMQTEWTALPPHPLGEKFVTAETIRAANYWMAVVKMIETPMDGPEREDFQLGLLDTLEALVKRFRKDL